MPIKNVEIVNVTLIKQNPVTSTRQFSVKCFDNIYTVKVTYNCYDGSLSIRFNSTFELEIISRTDFLAVIRNYLPVNDPNDPK